MKSVHITQLMRKINEIENVLYGTGGDAYDHVLTYTRNQLSLGKWIRFFATAEDEVAILFNESASSPWLTRVRVYDKTLTTQLRVVDFDSTGIAFTFGKGNSRFFYVRGSGGIIGSVLYQVNENSGGAGQFIGTLGSPGEVYWHDDANEILYVAGALNFDKLIITKVDTSTALATIIGSTEIPAGNHTYRVMSMHGDGAYILVCCKIQTVPAVNYALLLDTATLTVQHTFSFSHTNLAGALHSSAVHLFEQSEAPPTYAQQAEVFSFIGAQTGFTDVSSDGFLGIGVGKIDDYIYVLNNSLVQLQAWKIQSGVTANGEQTTWFYETKDRITFRIGFSDGGVSVPPLDAPRLKIPTDATFTNETISELADTYLIQIRNALERLVAAAVILNPKTGVAFNFNDGDTTNNVYYVAMNAYMRDYGLTGQTLFKWARPIGENETNYYDIDIGELWRVAETLYDALVQQGLI